jgi:hypothetical protein
VIFGPNDPGICLSSGPLRGRRGEIAGAAALVGIEGCRHSVYLVPGQAEVGGLGAWSPEPDRALPDVVPYTEQEVGLAQRARGDASRPGTLAFFAPHEVLTHRSGALSAKALNIARPADVWKTPDDFGSAGSRS